MFRLPALLYQLPCSLPIVLPAILTLHYSTPLFHLSFPVLSPSLAAPRGETGFLATAIWESGTASARSQ